MQNAVIYSRAKENTSGETTKGQALEIIEHSNFAKERAKYRNFWVGVNRGVSIDSKNPKIVDNDEFTRAREAEKVSESCKLFLEVFNMYFYLPERKQAYVLPSGTA